MARRFVRESKYRHVFGTPSKSEETFSGIRGVNDGTTEGHICAVNPKFVAVATKPQGGGAFLVLKVSEVGRVNPDNPQVRGHKGKVLDLAWNPFNDNVIASGDDYGMVCIWMIPDVGLQDDLIEPLMVFDNHQKKISKMLWHPTAENILLTTAWDNKVAILNLETGCVAHDIAVPDTPYCVDWNYDGSRFIISCKDKKFRIYDPRSGSLILEWQGHEGGKAQMVAFSKSGILSSGFSRMSDRQYGLWDEKTGKNLVMENIDTSNGVNQIIYDRDTGLFYFAAKGDSVIRYYELTDEDPYIFWLSMYQAKPQTAVASMAKRGCNVNACEVMRFYRIEKMDKGNTNAFSIIPTAMTVPRKSEMFQEDIFPDTPGDEPALTADEWLGGKNKDPILMSLKTGYKTKEKTVRVGASVNKMAAISKAQSGPAKGGSASSGDSVPSSELKALKDEIQSLKATVERNEEKIASLETKVNQLLE